MNAKDYHLFQIKSILIVRYISEYCFFEKIVLEIFRKEIVKLDHRYKNKLYFYYGIYVSHNVSFDFEKNKVLLAEENSYNDEELFKSLNLNKIIKFERNESLIKTFVFNIDSVIRKTTCFTFYDCCKKLIDMRNKLAHEVDSISFKDKDIIELLPYSYLNDYDYEYVRGLDFKDADEISFALFSNIVYMRMIIKKLQELVIDNSPV